jgi:serine phosphatase RsbU (regulator of sigma subunit)
MFSDGIQDQFGGEAGNERKFMRKNLINLLASNFTLPMSEQMSKLNEAITAWRGNRAQIDDMTLVGIRVA